MEIAMPEKCKQLTAINPRTGQSDYSFTQPDSEEIDAICSRLRAAQKWWGAAALARIMRDGEELIDGCGKKRAIHVANRRWNELQFGSALRHSRHERRYAASLRPSICQAQETHS
jgi:acyl-CoA reductase-like NAD-dependent aldehyde dehydrogenase